MEKAQSVRMCRKNTEGRGNHPDFTALSSISICRNMSQNLSPHLSRSTHTRQAF